MRSSTTVLLLALAALPAAAQEQQPAPQAAPQAAPGGESFSRRAVGDWTVVCAASGSPCVMEQLGKAASGETALNIQIERLKEPQRIGGQQVTAVANILTPTGVLLQNGLQLQVDGGAKAASPFFVCQTSGCVVRAPLQNQVLDSFRRGASARFTYALLDRNDVREVSANVSLSGFTRAFDELK
jgi:invasion protein IalB